MALVIIYSGSYMLYERHCAAPKPEVFSEVRLQTPNYSGRMDNLRAAILRPQINNLEANIDRWNERYRLVEKKLKQVRGIEMPERLKEERLGGCTLGARRGA